MGAIAGILYPKFSPLSYAIGSSLEALKVRTKSSASTYLYKNLELGARGFPIGHNERQTISLAFDGEITNQDEVAKQLSKEGYRIEGLSLPDLLVRAYEHWGDRLCAHIRGPFAIALFDQKTHELTLIRDRLGICPLYWAYINETLLFASELKALLATGFVPQVVDQDAISSYLFLGYIPQDLTPIQGVNKLLPGCRLTIAPEGKLQITPYWSYANLLAENAPLSEEELNEALQEELRLRVSSGNVGYLTQGTLSQGVLASAFSEATSLTVEYQNDNEDQVEKTLALSNKLGHQIRTTSLSPPALLDALPEIVWHLDEPLADPNVMGMWSLLKGQAQGLDHLFLSVGANELLAAHPRYHDPHLLELLSREPTETNPGWIHRLALQPLRWISPGALFHSLRKSHTHPWLTYFINSQALFDPQTLRSLSPQIPHFFDPDVFTMRLKALSELGDSAATFLFLDTKTLLPGKLLLPCDRLTSAADIPWSAPFLSERIVELMAHVPDQQKVYTNSENHPLHRLLAPSLQGSSFSPPSSRNFLNPYQGDTTIREAFGYLINGTLVETGWLDRRWMKRALERRLPNQVTFTQLWGLLNLEVWMRLFINAPISSTPPQESLFQILQKG